MEKKPITKTERFLGCILAGAIGDAWGSGFENQTKQEEDTYYLVRNSLTKEPPWEITDDTQLTLATIEAMTNHEEISPEIFAKYFLHYYREGKLRGLGASTLKALKELDFGGHWSQVGRRGEFAAGNGAAMRIAPLAFIENLSFYDIRNICFITHHNDEAYIGAKCVIIAIREILRGRWNGESNLIELVIRQLPDTRVRDRLFEIKDIKQLSEIGKKGNNGYVVNSVPLALAAANQVLEIGMDVMFSQLIEIGGDTDTNCSIAGQIAGTLLGSRGIPRLLIRKFRNTNDFGLVLKTASRLARKKNWERYTSDDLPKFI